MFVELQDFGYDEGALDTDRDTAGEGVDNAVRAVALHEQAECAHVLAYMVIGAKTGNVNTIAVYIVRVDGESEVEELAGHVVLVLAKAVEGAAAVYTKIRWGGGRSDGNGRASRDRVGLCEDLEEGEEQNVDAEGVRRS